MKNSLEILKSAFEMAEEKESVHLNNDLYKLSNLKKGRKRIEGK